MRRTAFLFLNIMFLSSLICFSQKIKNADSEKFDINKYRYDVSLDMYNLLKSGAGRILFRYSPSKLCALRINLSGNTGKTDYYGQVNPGAPSVNYANVKGLDMEAGLGFEFHRNSKRFQLFGGPEISFRRQYYNVKYDPSYTGNKISGPNVRHFSVGGVGGIKYYIFDRLSVSTETTLKFQWLLSKTVDPGAPFSDDFASVKSQTLILDNLRAFNISFHF